MKRFIRSGVSRIGRLIAAAGFVPLLLTVAVQSAAAHPLGNTSVNIYERVEVRGDGIRVRFVMDVSELPALDEQQFADTNDDGTVDDDEAATYLDGFWVYLEPRLQLSVGSTQLVLERSDESLTFPPGQGGLKLMRVVFDLAASHPPAAAGEALEAQLTESTFEGVPGWHEIVVVAGDGATLTRSDVPAEDVSDELTNYPPEMLATPLSVRTANFAYALDAATAPSPSPSAAVASASPAPQPSTTPPPARPVDPLVDLLGGELNAASAGFAVLIALGLGAVHALSPGHGKTLVAAYVIGTRASVGQALWLGLTVAVTHTAGVFVLGLGTWFAAEWFAPERVVSWLAVVTGVLVIGLGALLVWRTRVTSNELHAHGPDGQAHRHPHAHGRPHGPTSGIESHSPELRTRDVAAIGVVGGLVPSGSALILLLSSIALGEIPFGLVLIVMFGLGMALVLVGLATGIVLLRRAPFLRARNVGPRVRRFAGMLPLASGVAVVVLGIALTVEAVRNLR